MSVSLNYSFAASGSGGGNGGQGGGIGGGTSEPKQEDEIEQIIELIVKFVEPTLWEQNGGECSITNYKKTKSHSLFANKNVVFTCGSSVTASVLGVAYSLISNNYMPKIYVGSWSEYGKIVK